MFKNKFQFWWVAISLCLATLIIRLPFTGFNTIIGSVISDYNLSKTEAGLILALPTIIMGVFSAFVDRLDRKYGFVLGIAIAIVLIVAGLLFRDIITMVAGNGGFGLLLVYLGTIFLSLGITIMNVLYPTFINGFFQQQMSAMMSINGTNIALSALLGVFFSLFMLNVGYNWHEVGVLWFIISVAILLFYLPTILFTRERMQAMLIEQAKTSQDAKENATSAIPTMWLQLAAWSLAIALGIESANFYFAISWFPQLVGDAITPNQLTFLLTMFQVVSVPFSIIAPIMLVKKPELTNKSMLIISSLFALSTIALLYTSNFWLLVIIFTVFGVAAGYLITAYMALISMKTTKTAATSKLSGMSQTVAYMLTAIVIFWFGISVDLTQSFDLAIWTIVLINLVFPLFTYLATAVSIKESKN